MSRFTEVLDTLRHKVRIELQAEFVSAAGGSFGQGLQTASVLDGTLSTDDPIFRGLDYQEVLSNFPLASRVLTRLSLALTAVAPEVNGLRIVLRANVQNRLVRRLARRGAIRGIEDAYKAAKRALKFDPPVGAYLVSLSPSTEFGQLGVGMNDGVAIQVIHDPLFTIPYQGAELPTAFLVGIKNMNPTAHVPDRGGERTAGLPRPYHYWAD